MAAMKTAAAAAAIGLCVGVGVLIAAPGLLRAARPMALRGLALSKQAAQRGGRSAAAALEDLEDLFAELRAKRARPSNRHASR